MEPGQRIGIEGTSTNLMHDAKGVLKADHKRTDLRLSLHLFVTSRYSS